MKPVATVVYNKQSKKPYYKVLDELLRDNFGYEIQRKEYGTIIFDPGTIEGVRNYINNDAEAAALISAPYVLKRGKAITGHKNHKGKENVSVTFAAPVVLNERIGNVAVCVMYGKGQVHSLRVLTAEGKTFELLKIEDTESTITGHSAKAMAEPYIDSVSNNSIYNSNEDVKQKQLEIILKTNPAYSDSFTWIRKVEDIHTLEETLELNDWAEYNEFDPDLTRKDILNAIEKGKIKKVGQTKVNSLKLKGSTSHSNFKNSVAQNGADVNKELVADLVGDYIFTDKDFVRKLSTENRNVFQKIYDEVKYLCKVATAGSKEARELEKVKKTFAEVYKESGKTDIRYSLNEDKATVDESTYKLIERLNNGEDVPIEEINSTPTISQLLEDAFSRPETYTIDTPERNAKRKEVIEKLLALGSACRFVNDVLQN